MAAAADGHERADLPEAAADPEDGASPQSFNIPLMNRVKSKPLGGEEFEDEPVGEERLLLKAFILLICVVIVPLWCRMFYLAPSTRCGLVILAMLLLNMAKVMPLFSTALFVPVLGTLCAVLGDSRSVKDTSTLLISTVFNNTSFMVLGALVINGIFLKCGLDQRFMRALLRTFSLEGPMFLLVLLMGGALLCSVLFSGSMVLVAALAGPMRSGLDNGTLPANAVKRILLASAIAANAGSSILPISSAVTMITVSLLNDFGLEIEINTWVMICFPSVMVALFGCWLMLLIAFPVDKVDAAAVEDASAEAMPEPVNVEITDWHMIFMGVGLAAVVGITVYAKQLEPIIGHSACLALATVVIVFGSGFMSREEFNQLDWDILALVGGTNVVAFLVRETGLGVELAEAVVATGLVEAVPYHGLLAIMMLIAMMCATCLQHSITGVLLMPLTVAVGIKLQVPETTAILVATCLPFGMALNYSSFDNVLAHRTSQSMGRKDVELTDANWRVGGGCTGLFGAVSLLTLGYHIAFQIYTVPPPVWVVENMTPENLTPRVVKENLKPTEHFGMSSFLAVNASATTPFGFAAKLAAGRPRRLRKLRKPAATLAPADR